MSPLFFAKEPLTNAQELVKSHTYEEYSEKIQAYVDIPRNRRAIIIVILNVSTV